MKHESEKKRFLTLEEIHSTLCRRRLGRALEDQLFMLICFCL